MQMARVSVLDSFQQRSNELLQHMGSIHETHPAVPGSKPTAVETLRRLVQQSVTFQCKLFNYLPLESSLPLYDLCLLSQDYVYCV